MNSTNGEPWWGVTDWTELGPDYYRIDFTEPGNCARCVFFRTERRLMFLRKRADLCAVNAPWWPNAAVCPLYRGRSEPLKHGGWANDGRR
jgi:hypothetical protein